LIFLLVVSGTSGNHFIVALFLLQAKKRRRGDCHRTALRLLGGRFGRRRSLSGRFCFRRGAGWLGRAWWRLLGGGVGFGGSFGGFQSFDFGEVLLFGRF